MASITASTFTLGPLQVDGRRYVTERHTDNAGVVHSIEYLAPVAADYTAIMTARSAVLVAQLEAQEYVKLIGIAAAPVFVYGSASGFIAAMREVYKSANRDDLARIAAWIMDRFDQGTFSDVQLRTAFGLSVTQWNNLKAKMVNLRTWRNGIELAVGE